MITVVAIVRAKPGNGPQVRAALESLVEPTHAEVENHGYVLHEDLDDPNTFVFYEQWDSREGLTAHLATAHVASALKDAGELLAQPMEVHSLRAIAG